MNRRLGVALALAFGLHAIVFTLLHVRVGPRKEPEPARVVEPTPTEFETTNVALGEVEGEPIVPGGRASAAPGTAPDPGTETAAGTETAPGTETASETETAAGTETASETETAAGTGTGAGTGPGTAAGTGTGTATGTGTGPGTGPATGTAPRAPVDRGALLGQILARVRAARRYPEAARRRELEGTVHVRFTIGVDGAPHAIATTNADPLLEAAAKEAIERSAPLPFVDGPVELDVDYTLSD